MLLVGFTAAFLLKPSSAGTTTETYTTTVYASYTTTVTLNQSSLLSCVVTHYEVEAIELYGNGTGVFTSTTDSKVISSYTTTTSLVEAPGYITSTSATIIGTTTTTGPLAGQWDNTVCTWLT